MDASIFVANVPNAHKLKYCHTWGNLRYEKINNNAKHHAREERYKKQAFFLVLNLCRFDKDFEECLSLRMWRARLCTKHIFLITYYVL